VNYLHEHSLGLGKTEVVCTSTRHATVCPINVHQSDCHMHASQINNTNAHTRSQTHGQCGSKV